MSSSDAPHCRAHALQPSRRRALGLAAAALLALPLGACFRPLNGPTASGASVRDVLTTIKVGDVTTANVSQERFGHHVRSELVYELNGTGTPGPTRYNLALTAGQAVSNQIVESSTGRADAATLIGTVQYSLTNLDGKIVARGIASGSAVYDRNPQRFATLRAARDAEIRLGKLLAEQIRTRLAAALLTAS